MKNLLYTCTIGATALLITLASCDPKATEDELNDFRALAEANDDSLSNEIADLQDSLQNAQNKQFVTGTLTGTYADSDTPFSIDFDFRETLSLFNNFFVRFDDGETLEPIFFDRQGQNTRNGAERVLVAEFGIARTVRGIDFNDRSPAEDLLIFDIEIDLDANTVIDIDQIGGQISQTISGNQNFVYGFSFSNHEIDEEDVTGDITNISYNAETEILSFDYSFSWGADAGVGSNNNKAATLAGTVNVTVPKEVYEAQPSDNNQFRN